MIINVRTFLRDFSSLKSQARRGETVRVRDRDGEFLFVAAKPETARKSLLGSARGKIAAAADLTAPTLPDEAWKPSL